MIPLYFEIVNLDLWSWLTLEYEITNHPDPPNIPALIERLPSTCVSDLGQKLRTSNVVVPPGVLGYRATRHGTNRPEHPRHPFLMRGNPKPPLQRANFAGQNVLYCAGDELTCIAEVLRRRPSEFNVMRPEAMSKSAEWLSVAAVEVHCEVRFCDLTEDKDELISNLRWRMSLPVDSFEKLDHYNITAAISHLARLQGLNGITFRSSWNSAGQNYVVFDPLLFHAHAPRLVKAECT